MWLSIDAEIYQRILTEEFLDDHWYAFRMKWYRRVGQTMVNIHRIAGGNVNCCTFTSSRAFGECPRIHILAYDRSLGICRI